jgi:hypothetical protein
MKGGCCVASAGKCFIVGTFDELKGHTSAGCNEVIVEMAKYLLQISWPTGTEDPSAGGGGIAAASWQPYIESMLVGKGDIDQALICSKTDGTIWASTPDFGVSDFFPQSFLNLCLVENISS